MPCCSCMSSIPIWSCSIPLSKRWSRTISSSIARCAWSISSPIWLSMWSCVRVMTSALSVAVEVFSCSMAFVIVISTRAIASAISTRILRFVRSISIMMLSAFSFVSTLFLGSSPRVISMSRIISTSISPVPCVDSTTLTLVISL